MYNEINKEKHKTPGLDFYILCEPICLFSQEIYIKYKFFNLCPAKCFVIQAWGIASLVLVA
jgi:hypothetical protein